MHKCTHFCFEWSIVGYGTGAFWDFWIWSIHVLNFVEMIYNTNETVSVRGKLSWWLLWHMHDDVMGRKRFPHQWPFVRGIHRSLLDFPHEWPGPQSFDNVFVICLIKLANDTWQETLWHMWRHSDILWVQTLVLCPTFVVTVLCVMDRFI